MRALICDSYDGLDALRVGDMPDPTPLPGTALIAVKAAAVNAAAGATEVKPSPPPVG